MCTFRLVATEEVCGSAKLAENHPPGPKRRGFALSPTASDRDHRFVAAGSLCDLLGKAGFADPPRSTNHDDLPVALFGGLQELR
jgi:hypothetical protein